MTVRIYQTVCWFTESKQLLLSKLGHTVILSSVIWSLKYLISGALSKYLWTISYFPRGAWGQIEPDPFQKNLSGWKVMNEERMIQDNMLLRILAAMGIFWEILNKEV